MARRPRASPASLELRYPRRSPLFVDLANWYYFHAERRRIDREYPAAHDVRDPDSRIVRSLRESAMDELRAEMPTLLNTGAATYLIPV